MVQSDAVGTRKAGSIAALTDRQRACLLRVAEGRTSKEIAREFAISPSTVDNHINAALKVIGCANRLEAARLVRDAGAICDELMPAAPLTPSGEQQLPHKAEVDSFEVAQTSQLSQFGSLSLPPLGGRRNEEKATRRLILIMQVVLLGLMVGVGTIVSILGVVRLLAP